MISRVQETKRPLDPQRIPKTNLLLRLISLPLDKNWVDRHSRQLLAMLIAFAACIVLPYGSYNSVAGPYAFSRTDGTWETALNLVNGKGYSDCIKSYFPFCGPTDQQTAMREPIPVLMMAAAMLVSPAQLSGFVLQSLFYLGTLLIIYSLLKGYDRRAALLAALLWTTSIPAISELGADGGGMACAFFLSVGILFFQKGREVSRIRYWIFSGLFLGLASLSRSVCTVIPVGLVLGLLWERRWRLEHGRLEYVGPALMILATFCLVMAPWIIRNDIVFGTPVTSSTLVGYNVFRYNYILRTKGFVPHYVGINEAKSALMNLIQQSHLTGKENEAQMQALYMHAGLHIILSKPVGYLLLSLYRFLPLWFNTSVHAAYGQTIGWVDVFASVQQAILLVAGLVGAFVSRKTLWPLILSVILVSGAYMAVGSQLRYLVIAIPMIVILAASILPSIMKRIPDADHWIQRMEHYLKN